MELSHVDENGAKMVDVGEKSATKRTAVARGEARNDNSSDKQRNAEGRRPEHGESCGDYGGKKHVVAYPDVP